MEAVPSMPRQRRTPDLERLTERVAALETQTVAQRLEIEAARSAAADALRGVTGVNHYLSGDPNRKEDVGRIGELIASMDAMRARLNAVLGSLASIVLIGVLGVIAALVHR